MTGHLIAMAVSTVAAGIAVLAMVVAVALAVCPAKVLRITDRFDRKKGSTRHG